MMSRVAASITISRDRRGSFSAYCGCCSALLREAALSATAVTLCDGASVVGTAWAIGGGSGRAGPGWVTCPIGLMVRPLSILASWRSSTARDPFRVFASLDKRNESHVREGG